MQHPLVMMADMGLETGSRATRIAAVVWGRDDDGGGLAFKQEDIDKVVQVADHRDRELVAIFPMTAAHGTAIRSLAVSDLNKELLLSSEGLIPLLIDSLLLDQDHPRRDNPAALGKTDWEGAKGPVQRDFAEVLAQLAVFPPGREALLQDPSVRGALAQVAEEGYTEEARNFAEAALLALSDRQPIDTDQGGRARAQRRQHIMISCVQPPSTLLSAAARLHPVWLLVPNSLAVVCLFVGTGI